jgi:hypothetical protein
VGKPINCIADQSGPVSRDVVENHCLMTGAKTIYRTETNPYKHNEPLFPYPGIAPITNVKESGFEVKFHQFYKFTPMVLFGLSLLFYCPHFLWKTLEGGRFHNLKQELGWRHLLSSEDRQEQTTLAVNHLLDSRGRTNTLYCFVFFSLEYLNLILSTSALITINLIFDNQFVNYGFGNLYLPFLKQQIPRYDALDRLFPKVAKCDLEIFGPTGTLQKVDALCFLYQNFLNEIIIVVMCFWITAVVAYTWLYLVVYRNFFLFKRIRALHLHNRCSSNTKKDIDCIVNALGFCDWFLLKSLLAEISPITSYGIIKEMASELRKKLKDLKNA